MICYSIMITKSVNYILDFFGINITKNVKSSLLLFKFVILSLGPLIVLLVVSGFLVNSKSFPFLYAIGLHLNSWHYVMDIFLGQRWLKFYVITTAVIAWWMLDNTIHKVLAGNLNNKGNIETRLTLLEMFLKKSTEVYLNLATPVDKIIFILQKTSGIVWMHFFVIWMPFRALGTYANAFDYRLNGNLTQFSFYLTQLQGQYIAEFCTIIFCGILPWICVLLTLDLSRTPPPGTPPGK